MSDKSQIEDKVVRIRKQEGVLNQNMTLDELKRKGTQLQDKIKNNPDLGGAGPGGPGGPGGGSTAMWFICSDTFCVVTGPRT
jgi:hypothetical protein